MALQSDERYIVGSDNDGFAVTSHRIKLGWRKSGLAHFQSVMLEEIASCSVRSKSNPILLVLAVIAVVIGTVSAVSGRPPEGGPLVVGLIIGAVFVFAYFATKKKVVAFASAGETIFADASRMIFEEAKQLINLVENAKNDRFMLHAVPR